MKSVITSAILLLTICSCEHIEDATPATSQTTNTKNVTFIMKGLDVDYGETRATLASESITDLYVIEGTTLLCHQTSTDANFGAPSVTLSVGTHDLTFIASKSDGQAFTDHWTCTKVRDTYGTTLEYTVSSSTTKQVQLTRVNGKLMWTIEDAIPSTATTLSISAGQCYGLDADLNGTDASTYTASLNIASAQGITGYTPNTMILPKVHASDDTSESITASITITDGTNSLCSYTNTVYIYPNQVTNIHGSFFSGSPQLAMSLNTEWGTTNDVDVR